MVAHVVQLAAHRSSAVVDEPEAALVRRAQRGDKPAARLLLDRYFSYVHGLVFRLLPNDDEHDDLVQDTFVQAIKDLSNLAKPELFKPWLRGIAVNLVRNRLRRRSMLRALGLYRAAEVDITVELSADAPPDVVAELRAVYATVQRLTPELRTVLLLNHVEELTTIEIAETLNVSLSTVRRRLAAADAELRFELERGGRKP